MIQDCCENCGNWEEPKDKTLNYGMCTATKVSTTRKEYCKKNFKPKDAKPVADDKLDADLKLCRAHRDKLYLNPADFTNFDKFIDDRGCGKTPCGKECPVPHRQKNPWDAPIKGKADKPKEVCKPMKRTEKKDGNIADFLYIQARVIEKFAGHPEIWKKLDWLSVGELKDLLFGGSPMKTVPPAMGGQMQLHASAETKKMFADLEKKFEAEGQKAYDVTAEPLGEMLSESLKWTDEVHINREVWEPLGVKARKRDDGKVWGERCNDCRDNCDEWNIETPCEANRFCPYGYKFEKVKENGKKKPKANGN